MTGFGSGSAERDDVSATVEVRAVNHRHLKLSVRGAEPYPLMEADFEKLARPHVKRGSLLVHVGVNRAPSATSTRLDVALLASYVQQVEGALPARLVPGVLAGALGLPGVVPSGGGAGALPEAEWPAVAEAFLAAIDNLNRTRHAEGEAMARSLRESHAEMVATLAQAREALPGVMADYRARLLERVRAAIGTAGVTVEEANLVRELALYADRTDVSEEVVRLEAHLEQFAELVGSGDSQGAGRRLEFLAQELGREVNTMGSKAGDARLSRGVFDLKSALERVKELIANVE